MQANYICLLVDLLFAYPLDIKLVVHLHLRHEIIHQYTRWAKALQMIENTFAFTTYTNNTDGDIGEPVAEKTVPATIMHLTVREWLTLQQPA